MNFLTKSHNEFARRISVGIAFHNETKYYDYQFEQYQSNTKSTWRLINEITYRKKRDKTTIKALKIGNCTIISDARTMANTLNDYFINIGPILANNLPPSSIFQKDFLNNAVQRNSFFLTDDILEAKFPSG